MRCHSMSHQPEQTSLSDGQNTRLTNPTPRSFAQTVQSGRPDVSTVNHLNTAPPQSCVQNPVVTNEVPVTTGGTFAPIYPTQPVTSTQQSALPEVSQLNQPSVSPYLNPPYFFTAVAWRCLDFIWETIPHFTHAHTINSRDHKVVL